MRFLRPELVWWLVPALVVLVFARWRLRRQYAASTTVHWLNNSSFRASILRRLPTAVLFAALVLTSLALMDPVVRNPESEVQSRNRDIVLVLDMSDSMQTPIESVEGAPVEQTAVTRLDAVKAAMKAFVLLRHDDRLALVIFSDHAYVVCPLTFDHEYLLYYIDMVTPHSIVGEGRTAIGDALATSNLLLTRQSSGTDQHNQLVVLFTDGESNEGRDPVPVLTALHAQDIRVHLVAIELDPNPNNLRVQRVLDATTRYGGRIFNANTAQGINDASTTVDAIEKGLVTMKAYALDRPVYEWFALPALICLVGAIALCAIPFFIDQT